MKSPRKTGLVQQLKSDFTDHKTHALIAGFGGAIGMLQMFPGLVGLWPGGTLGSGTTGNLYYTDISGHGLDLTRNAGTFIVLSPSGVNRLVPYYWFNGSDGYAIHADANILDIQGNESGIWSEMRGLTIGGWFRFDTAAPASSEFIMSKWTGSVGARSYALTHEGTSGIPQFYVSSDGTASTSAGAGASQLSASVWYNIVGRFDPSTEVALFVNGVKLASNTTSIPATIHDSTTSFAMAANGTGGNLMDGQATLSFLCAAAIPDIMISTFYEWTRSLFSM